MKPVVSDAFNEGSVGNWFDMFQLKWQSTQNMWRRQLLQIKTIIFFRWGREELLRNVEMMGNGLIWRLCGSPIVSCNDDVTKESFSPSKRWGDVRIRHVKWESKSLRHWGKQKAY
jgi:hypothetical protein